MKKITIGIPMASDMVHRKFMQSLMSLQYPQGVEADINIVSGYQLPFSRNRIIQHALDSNSDYVFFVDADMVFQPDVLLKLYAHDLPMVNALAFRRTFPSYPCIFKWVDANKCYETVEYTNGLLEVDATGMACHLIKTEVFRKMKKPYYYYRDNLFSSDLTFCENAKKLGYKIMIDTDVKIGHIGAEQIITEDYYLKYLSEDKKKEYNNNMKQFLSSKENCAR
jgi:glycosyltransferase involved in cell wall biosynthesis